MGEEKSGSVRMYGLGVCQSDSWATILSKGTSYRMAMEWQTELEKTNNQLEELRNVVMKSGENGVNSVRILRIERKRRLGFHRI